MFARINELTKKRHLMFDKKQKKQQTTNTKYINILKQFSQIWIFN